MVVQQLLAVAVVVVLAVVTIAEVIIIVVILFQMWLNTNNNDGQITEILSEITYHNIEISYHFLRCNSYPYQKYLLYITDKLENITPHVK